MRTDGVCKHIYKHTHITHTHTHTCMCVCVNETVHGLGCDFFFFSSFCVREVTHKPWKVGILSFALLFLWWFSYIYIYTYIMDWFLGKSLLFPNLPFPRVVHIMGWGGKCQCPYRGILVLQGSFWVGNGEWVWSCQIEWICMFSLWPSLGPIKRVLSLQVSSFFSFTNYLIN